MTHKLRSVTILLALFAAFGLPALAQDLHPSRRPSPMGMARITVDDAYVRVVYSRPYKRGRDNIFGTEESGALVPFNEVWRTGANEAPEITATKELAFGEQTLPAGTYTLLATPGPESWTIHINSALGLNGTYRYNPETEEYEPAYSPENNVVEVTAPVGATDEEVDQFTISFERTEEGAEMIFRWIDTEVRVPFRVTG